MEQTAKKVADFLTSRGMAHEDIDIDKNCDIFLDEMKKGLAGQSSSLAMLATYIETDKEIPLDRKVIVMDAGGSNFRVAVAHFDQKRRFVCEKLPTTTMPGSEGRPVGKDEFFGKIVDYMAGVMDASPNVGFCFSYPMEMSPDRDGKVLFFSKEVKAKEVEGQMIGLNLNLAVRKSGHATDKHVVLLNDTVAALLAGTLNPLGKSYDSYIGFILGTGTNCSYVERNSNIIKAKDLDPAAGQIVNIESGGFGRGPQGQIDLELDRDSVSPGTNTFEKMISGAYLGEVCLRTARAAAEEGLLSSPVAEKLAELEALGTEDVDDFMRSPESTAHSLAPVVGSGSRQDIDALCHLFDRLIERAAKLTAINLSSVVLKSEKGKDPNSPVCILAEGTTFYKLKSLKSKVEHYLKQYLEDTRQRYYEIVNVEDATLIGAAIAGLTN